MRGVRAIVYDKTCVWKRRHLSPIWASGARLYKRLGRTDAVQGVANWDEALTWLGTQREQIDEIQYWGHGQWGRAFVGEDVLDVSAFDKRRSQLEAIRERMAPDALLWFRTCETFGTNAGLDFAQGLADFFGRRVAGHTFIIAFHQSGLHALEPGARPDWSPTEGLAKGTGENPVSAKWSWPWHPHTVTALDDEIPAEWITR
jgi:hypothetical protein